ncbi:MAG: tRNA (adenosine(37)-N6)-threonylcarbamoyltransferase complex dimerization subunit type 1 TsaB [Ferruginibacter sp.]
MSLILQIDTALDTAIVSIAQNGELLHELTNNNQKDHAGFLQPAIDTILKQSGLTLKTINAIAVSAGPGSYTGLRVGMASAKGLAFALNKPLITLGTLEITAKNALIQNEKLHLHPGTLYCPMIDARRMEVYTALYDNMLNTRFEPSSMILTAYSFANWLLKNKICFFGNGASKFQAICTHPNASFLLTINNSLAMSKLSFEKFINNDFADVAYSTPFYLKEFFSEPGKK